MQLALGGYNSLKDEHMGFVSLFDGKVNTFCCFRNGQLVTLQLLLDTDSPKSQLVRAKTDELGVIDCQTR